MADLEFYFDFSSPNAYLSAVQLERLKQQHDSLGIDWKPVFLGGIMQELETTPPAMQNELKANYLMRDLRRWSEYYDIPFDFPESFPVNSLSALRTFLVIDREETAVNFAQRVFRACWAEDRSIENHEILRDCLPAGAREQVTIPDDITRDAVKEDLKDRTDRAMDRGVFGCPTFFIGDEMFWGKDRLDFVKRELNLG